MKVRKPGLPNYSNLQVVNGKQVASHDPAALPVSERQDYAEATDDTERAEPPRRGLGAGSTEVSGLSQFWTCQLAPVDGPYSDEPAKVHFDKTGIILIEGPAINAINGTTGLGLWTYKDISSYHRIIDVSEHQAIVCAGHAPLYLSAIDLRDGLLIWAKPYISGQVGSSPASGLLYISNDNDISALNIWNGRYSWTIETSDHAKLCGTSLGTSCFQLANGGFIGLSLRDGSKVYERAGLDVLQIVPSVDPLYSVPSLTETSAGVRADSFVVATGTQGDWFRPKVFPSDMETAQAGITWDQRPLFWLQYSGPWNIMAVPMASGRWLVREFAEEEASLSMRGGTIAYIATPNFVEALDTRTGETLWIRYMRGARLIERASSVIVISSTRSGWAGLVLNKWSGRREGAFSVIPAVLNSASLTFAADRGARTDMVLLDQTSAEAQGYRLG